MIVFIISLRHRRFTETWIINKCSSVINYQKYVLCFFAVTKWDFPWMTNFFFSFSYIFHPFNDIIICSYKLWPTLLEKYRKVTDNPWFYVWVSDCVIFSIYAYAWDVRQDFDLWDCKAQVNTKCLRDELIYESKVSKQTLRIHLIFICIYL